MKQPEQNLLANAVHNLLGRRLMDVTRRGNALHLKFGPIREIEVEDGNGDICLEQRGSIEIRTIDAAWRFRMGTSHVASNITCPIECSKMLEAYLMSDTVVTQTFLDEETLDFSLTFDGKLELDVFSLATMAERQEQLRGRGKSYWMIDNDMKLIIGECQMSPIRKFNLAR